MKTKMLSISLMVYFWSLYKFPQLTSNWQPWKICTAIVCGALVMWAIIYAFLREDGSHVNPDDYVWFNYANGAFGAQPRGWYFWTFDFRYFYGPYSTKDEAVYYFRHKAKEQWCETHKGNKASGSRIRFD